MRIERIDGGIDYPREYNLGMGRPSELEYRDRGSGEREIAISYMERARDLDYRGREIDMEHMEREEELERDRSRRSGLSGGRGYKAPGTIYKGTNSAVLGRYRDNHAMEREKERDREREINREGDRDRGIERKRERDTERDREGGKEREGERRMMRGREYGRVERGDYNREDRELEHAKFMRDREMVREGIIKVREGREEGREEQEEVREGREQRREEREELREGRGERRRELVREGKEEAKQARGEGVEGREHIIESNQHTREERDKPRYYERRDSGHTGQRRRNSSESHTTGAEKGRYKERRRDEKERERRRERERERSEPSRDDKGRRRSHSKGRSIAEEVWKGQPQDTSESMGRPEEEIAMKEPKDYLLDDFLWDLTKELEADSDVRARLREAFISLRETVMGVFPTATLDLQGSASNSLFAKTSNMYLSLQLPNTLGFPTMIAFNHHVIQAITNEIRNRRPYFNNVIPIFNARIPFVKFTAGTVQCELSVNNTSGLVISRLIELFIKIDKRVRPLLFAVKRWADFNSVKGAGQSSLSSLSWIIMTLFYLQFVCDPVVIPPLVDICDHICMDTPIGPNADNPNSGFNEAVESLKNRLYKNEKLDLSFFFSKNTETVAELFIGVFRYFKDFNFDTYGITLRSSVNYSKDDLSNRSTARSISTNYYCEVAIEEPFELTNTAIGCSRIGEIQSLITQTLEMVDSGRWIPPIGPLCRHLLPDELQLQIRHTPLKTPLGPQGNIIEPTLPPNVESSYTQPPPMNGPHLAFGGQRVQSQGSLGRPSNFNNGTMNMNMNIHGPPPPNMGPLGGGHLDRIQNHPLPCTMIGQDYMGPNNLSNQPANQRSLPNPQPPMGMGFGNHGPQDPQSNFNWTRGVQQGNVSDMGIKGPMAGRGPINLTGPGIFGPMINGGNMGANNMGGGPNGMMVGPMGTNRISSTNNNMVRKNVNMNFQQGGGPNQIGGCGTSPMGRMGGAMNMNINMRDHNHSAGMMTSNIRPNVGGGGVIPANGPRGGPYPPPMIGPGVMRVPEGPIRNQIDGNMLGGPMNMPRGKSNGPIGDNPNPYRRGESMETQRILNITGPAMAGRQAVIGYGSHGPGPINQMSYIPPMATDNQVMAERPTGSQVNPTGPLMTQSQSRTSPLQNKRNNGTGLDVGASRSLPGRSTANHGPPLLNTPIMAISRPPPMPMQPNPHKY